MNYPECYEPASMTSRVWAMTILTILEFENETEFLCGSWADMLGLND